MGKKKFLSLAVSGLFILGTAFVGLVFIVSLGPRDSAAYQFTRIPTESISIGEHKVISFLGTPIVFYKRSDGSIVSFTGISTYRNCKLEYSPPGHLKEGWEGGWYDPCHVGAWDNEGKFIVGGNSGPDLLLEDLRRPDTLSWDGSVAVLHP